MNPEIEFIWIKGRWEQELKEGKGELKETEWRPGGVVWVVMKKVKGTEKMENI